MSISLHLPANTGRMHAPYSRFTNDQNGIPELVRAKVAGIQFFGHLAERGVAGEGAEQFVMAGARLVRPGEDRIHDAQAARRSNALSRQSLTGPHAPVAIGGVLESPDD